MGDCPWPPAPLVQIPLAFGLPPPSPDAILGRPVATRRESDLAATGCNPLLIRTGVTSDHRKVRATQLATQSTRPSLPPSEAATASARDIQSLLPRQNDALPHLPLRQHATGPQLASAR